MKAEFFKAVCPLEIGDTVAIKAAKDGESAVVFEITKRTAKTVTYAAIHHAGRYNENRREEKRAKVHDWGSREVFFAGSETVEA